MFKKILIGFSVILVVILMVIAGQPDEYRVTRSAVIAKPAWSLYAQVNNLYNWQAWSPWEKIDPALKRTLQGRSAGVGATYIWTSSNKQVGEGRMTITENHPSDLVRVDVQLFKPFKCLQHHEFTFKQTPAGQTAVTWSMHGKNNFMSKACSLFMNCDTIVGPMFERGLINLGEVAAPAPLTNGKGRLFWDAFGR